jgi:hypothetical protein
MRITEAIALRMGSREFPRVEIVNAILIAIHDTPRNTGRAARSSRPAHKSIRSALESGFGC